MWKSAAVLASLLAGCVTDPATGELALEVQGGSTSRLFPAVGFLENGRTISQCGATLIGERTLLTAAQYEQLIAGGGH